ncbi:Uncharacterised protein [Mycolicibacterium vanbaalenii]|uniref:DUF5135 domain-containing protein n=1 Tax=Mycolicibacterium vanbaalenii TaxID=110539 RepID=A0A5S9NHP9_MYCVN|nr:spirocyclase AveC family protein [Mycolicibacterium vanbaalenii]CAA0089264.1 Uncharacterised protein [Mycolicibacterium vanbaalenii]
MSTELTPALIAGLTFAYVGGVLFLAFGVYLSIRRGRLHPLLLVSISAISFSWIEAPYDWAVYAQFAPALPRMPPWWPMNYTWGGGLPSAVPVGYIPYFVLPAVIGAALGRRAVKRFGWRRPQTLLGVGFLVGFCWALLFNGFFGPRLGVFYYGYVIDGLAIFAGSRFQYPIYDAVAMGLQMMVLTYLLGRTDERGRNVIEIWSDRRSSGKVGSSLLSIAVMVVAGHLMYLAVFAPHLATKLGGHVTVGPTEQLFPGIENQPR